MPPRKGDQQAAYLPGRGFPQQGHARRQVGQQIKTRIAKACLGVGGLGEIDDFPVGLENLGHLGPVA